jgi:hypothetical protein
LLSSRHLGDQRCELLELPIVDAQGGEGASLAFDDAPRLEQFERPDVLGALAPAGRVAIGDVHARGKTDLHQAIQLQGNDGFAHGRPRNAERLGQLAFGRQTLTQLVFAVRDRLGELLGNLFVEAAGFWHGTEYPFPFARQQGRPSREADWPYVGCRQIGQGTSCFWPDQFATLWGRA